MIKKFILSILIASMIILALPGCWDRKELNELGIVMAIGLDKDTHTGNIVLTSQVVRPGSLEKQGGSSKEPPYEIVVTSGTTVFEAIRNTVKEFDRRSFFSHIKVIVVNEILAREGLGDLIDFIARTHEIRKFTWLVVADGKSSMEMLGVKHGIESVQANYMEGIIKRQGINSDVTTSGVIDFIKKMPGDGIHPVTGVFRMIQAQSAPIDGKEPEPREGLALSGTAAFKKDKLVGFLNDEETRGLNIIYGNKRSGALNIPSPADDEKKISIEMTNTGSTIRPVIEDGRISFIIEVKAGGNITEVQDDIDVSNPDQFNKVNHRFTEFINNNVNIAVDKVQKDLKVDILGFGSALQRKYPKEWEKIKDHWDTLFPEVAYKIKAETDLTRTGLLLKPMNAKKTDE